MKKLILALITFFTIPYPYSYAQINWEEYEPKFKACSEKRDLNCILSVFDEIIAAYPDSVSPYAQKASFQYDIKDFEGSYANYSEAMKLESDSIKLSRLYVNRSSNMAMLGKYSKANDDLRQAQKLNPKDDAIKINLSLSLIDRKNYDEAISLLREVTDTSFRKHALMNIGFCYQEKEMHDSAIYYFDQTILMQETHDFAYNNKAYSLFKLGKTKEALKMVNKAIDLNSLNAYAYRNRALIYISQGKTNQACEDLNKAQNLRFEETYGSECKKLLKEHCE